MGGIGLTSATYPLQLPPFPRGFAAIKIFPHAAASVSRSPFTGTRQVYEWPGEYWEASVQLPPMSAELGRAWVAWLALLDGPVGTFLLTDTSQRNPRGSFAGAPVVNGAGQTGKTLAIRGLTPNAKLVARSGDMIQIGDGYSVPARLYMNLLDVDADGGGDASLRLFPRLRESPADGLALVTRNAAGQFALASKDDPNYQTDTPFWTVDSALTYGVTFDCVEAV